jgi:uncharacterized protein
MPASRKDGCFVAGGMSHDFDFARLEILARLAVWPHVRMRVNAHFEDTKALENAAFLVSYTCNVAPSAAAEAALERFLDRGGRWLALHATNSILAWTEAGVASVHRNPAFFRMLGSEFKAHPLIGPYRVEVQAPDHPLVRGLGSFEIEDELYLSSFHAPVEVLLTARYSGDAPGFTESDWRQDDPVRPVMYLRRYGKGEVLYLTPGHARGHYDAPHRTPFYPKIERGAWTSPAFLTLLSRALAWAAGEPLESVA